MSECRLFQPASSYDGPPEKADDAQLPWNPALTTKYQTKFFQDSDFVLNRAWQLIPGSILVALLDTVRNRVLRFALDLRGQLGPEIPTVEKLPKSTIDASVVNYIYAGNVLIASHAENVSQITHTIIPAGDSAALRSALVKLGITPDGIAQLEESMREDTKTGQLTVGPKIKGWLANLGNYLSKEGLAVGVDVAKRAATKWILQHYGLDI
jgi:hypothetical protein